MDPFPPIPHRSYYSSFQQWKGFLADQPTQPLSFNKSSEALAHPDQPALSLSRQWEIDSIWFGAKGLQAIRSPNDFRLSFLPSAALNISNDEVVQPHGLDLARTRHIKLGIFNAHSARFSAFLFFPNAAKDMTSSTRNALSLERQKDLYDHVIIPAAFEAVSDPCRQELPRTYKIAYAKSRSFQERSENNRWKPEDVSRAVHLQYTIPAENLSQFWNLIAEKANSFRLATKSGELVSYFKDLKLLFQSHDLKNTFGRATLSESLHYFQASVLQAFDPAHLEIRSCWIDIGTRDYVVSPPSSSQPVREPCTVFWKSQCHPHLHEQLSRCAPMSPMNAQNFQRFLLRDLGDYQVKAKHTRASKPGHPDAHKPGIIRAKAYSCHKELFSVMFSGYELFGSGHLPLLALNQSMISDLSSANQAAMDTRNSTNYAIRKVMTFRLEAILTMWHDGYFEPRQNPHMAPKSLEVSAASARTDHEPFWVVPTKDINDFVFTQAVRFIVPLDHLFREAAISTTISPPSLILAFYTAQLFCRLLTYALTSKEQFSYDNWIWLSRWTARSRTHHTRELRERQGLGLSVIIQGSGMLWIPHSCIDWYDGHIALETLIQLYIPRNPFQRGLLSQMNVQRLAASAISMELSLRHLLQQAKNDFDRGCQ
ncbi:CocE/NonD family hydrolase [Fusarium oxysporum f. sp. albedinis]|nr:CocE/NonD family hydrolase [Fusarium oxysporum f. sp. albedinis]